ncbi:MAG: S41 family peptidase [Sphingomonadales bacterium]
MIARVARSIALVSFLFVTACGGDGSGTTTGTTTGGGTTTPTTDQCSLRNRQLWAQGVLNEWYLFPETLPASLDPAPYTTVDTYIDALTATARSQRRDRYFTYLTSIASEDAFYNSGSSAGFGIRLTTQINPGRAFIAEAFEGTPALAAGIDRGDEILSIGTSTGNLRAVSDIIASEGTGGVTTALGPSTAGTTRVLRVTGPSGDRTLTISKADYSLTPVSTRYGAKTIDDGGRRVAYLNLRTFISTADSQLRNAFAQFRAAGITDFIIDFRYNGGGLISTAELMGDLMGGNRFSSDVFDVVTYRPEKSGNNTTKRFSVQPQSTSPVRIAFIGTTATASASELVINGLVPYYGSRLALIGTNTYGKPVGQIAIDKSACDDRLRVIAFSLKNSANSDAYYDGLRTAVAASCAANDDLSKPLGDTTEASTRAALDFLAGRTCTPIAAGGQTSQSARAFTEAPRELLTPDIPDTAQREVPGLF